MKIKLLFELAMLVLFIIPPSFCSGLAGDLNRDGKIDYTDFAIFSSNWLKDVNDPESIVKIELNSDPNWTIEGQWQFGIPMGMGGSSYGNPDPNSGYTNSYVYGVNLIGDYNVTVGGPYCLTAGPFDCSSYETVEISFARWLNTDTANYARCKIEVSNNNGSTWETIWLNPTESPITDDQWLVVQYETGQYLAGFSHVYIRWSYEILDDRVYPYSGWNIDDVELLGRQVPDAGMTPLEWLHLYLYNVRSAIASYKIQHNGQLPGAGAASFEEALTGLTDVYGDVWVSGPSYGPYMQKLPTNPFNDLDTVGTNGAAGVGDSSHGWEFDTATGEFYPDFIDLNGDGDSLDAGEDGTDY